MIATALFDKEQGLVFPSLEGRGKFFGYQIAGALVIFTLSTLIFVSFFVVLKNIDCLRVSKVTEILGYDSAESGPVSDEDLKQLRKELNWKTISEKDANGFLGRKVEQRRQSVAADDHEVY